MIKKLKFREWKNFKDKFTDIVFVHDDEKLHKKWKKLLATFKLLEDKETRQDALKVLNNFFQSLPEAVRENFLRVRRDNAYEQDRKKIRLLKQTIASLESIMVDQDLKNYDAAVNYLLDRYEGVK